MTNQLNHHEQQSDGHGISEDRTANGKLCSAASDLLEVAQALDDFVKDLRAQADTPGQSLTIVRDILYADEADTLIDKLRAAIAKARHGKAVSVIAYLVQCRDWMGREFDYAVMAPSPEAALAFTRTAWPNLDQMGKKIDVLSAKEADVTSEFFGLDAEWHLVDETGKWLARLDVASDREELGLDDQVEG